MALATAPMLPGCEGSTSTMRMSVEIICYDCLIGGKCPGPFPRAKACRRCIDTPAKGVAFAGEKRAGSRGVYLACTHFSISLLRPRARAGEVIVRNLNRLESLTVTAKGRNDFVTEVDTQAEAEIIAIIRNTIRTTPFSRRKAEPPGITIPYGSSTHSMGRRTSCTNSPYLPFRSPASKKGVWNMRWCTTRCARRFSALRAAAAPHLDNRRIRVE